MLLLAGLLASPCAHGAEVRGMVELGPGRTGPVSVALLPLDGQPLPERAPREQVVHLRSQAFDPPYLVAQVGDRLRFVNDEEVYHILIAPYAAQPIQATLGKSGSAASETTVQLQRRGSLYVFCHIHHRAYARIDVVETPLARMLGADQRFEFRNVPPGRWSLRVASRSGDPVYRDLTAYTAPPPVELKLPALPATASGTTRLHADRVEALFPLELTQP